MDTVTPTAVCQNITVFLDGTGNASIVAADIDGGSYDNCDSLSMIVSKTSFTCSNIGPNSVFLIAIDGSGYFDSCYATVTVLDTVTPTAVCQNINVYLDGTGNATITAADVDGGSSDNCGSPTLSASPTSFTCSNLGPGWVVTLTATDGSSNSDTCYATVTVHESDVPCDTTVSNLTITDDGEVYCYNAINILTIAGVPGDMFTVEDGGNVTLIAGEKILFQYGTIVHPGGILHGYITTNNQFCNAIVPMVAAPVGPESDMLTDISTFEGGFRIKVFPNPTPGRFTLVLDSPEQIKHAEVTIYGMQGQKILQEIMPEVSQNRFRQEFSIESAPIGIYLVRVVSGKQSKLVKVIKQ